MITEIHVVQAESRGGTSEAPNNLPLGVQPLPGVSTKTVPDHLPVDAGSCTNFQEGQQAGPGEGLGGTGYGGLVVGSPASGYGGLKSAVGPGPSFQPESGAVQTAPVVQDPQIGVYGK